MLAAAAVVEATYGRHYGGYGGGVGGVGSGVSKYLYSNNVSGQFYREIEYVCTFSNQK